MAIEGRIAKIVDEYTLVINVGSAQGVKPGMKFSIYTPVEEVKDPESGESLGSWEIVKGYVEAVSVQERLSVCKSVSIAEEEEATPPRTLSEEMIIVSRSMGPGKRKNQPKLNVDRSAIAGMPQVGPITIGDSVRSIE